MDIGGAQRVPHGASSTAGSRRTGGSSSRTLTRRSFAETNRWGTRCVSACVGRTRVAAGLMALFHRVGTRSPIVGGHGSVRSGTGACREDDTRQMLRRKSLRSWSRVWVHPRLSLRAARCSVTPCLRDCSCRRRLICDALPLHLLLLFPLPRVIQCILSAPAERAAAGMPSACTAHSGGAPCLPAPWRFSVSLRTSW